MIITRTPFRVSFFGGGSDFPAWYESNGGGAVLSTAINKYCYITCRFLPPFFEHKSRIVWSKIEHIRDASEIEHPVVREAVRYLNIQEGIELLHNADLPARSGLGSSSTFTVGALHALKGLLGEQVTKRQLALEAIHLEQELLKEHVGCQDQTIAAYGGFNRIDFGGPERIRIQPVMVPAQRLREFQDHLLLFFTGMSRYSSDIAHEHVKSMQSKSSDISALRDMVDSAMSILLADRDIDDFGKLLHEGWRIKRGLTSKVSSVEIDDLYDEALHAGAIGGKLLGAGGGGFMLLFAKPHLHASIRERLRNFLHVPFSFDHSGSQVIYYEPNAASNTYSMSGNL